MFSVVITTKDRLAFLKRAVQSVLDSNTLPVEIIIINDAGELFDLSDLDSLEVDIRVVNNSVSRGANYCRNLGVETSVSQYIFFLDDDDAVEPSSFQSRLDILLANPKVGLVYTGIKIVESSDLNRVVREVFPSDVNDYLITLLDTGNVIGSTSRVAVRKKVFEKSGRFDEKLGSLQDYDLWIRMSMECKISHDSLTSVIYTIHTNNKQVSSNYIRYLDSGIYLAEKYQESLKKRGLYNRFLSGIFLRIAISASSTSFKDQVKFSLKSFLLRPTFKALILMLVPGTLLKRFYSYT